MLLASQTHLWVPLLYIPLLHQDCQYGSTWSILSVAWYFPNTYTDILLKYTSPSTIVVYITLSTCVLMPCKLVWLMVSNFQNLLPLDYCFLVCVVTTCIKLGYAGTQTLENKQYHIVIINSIPYSVHTQCAYIVVISLVHRHVFFIRLNDRIQHWILGQWSVIRKLWFIIRFDDGIQHWVIRQWSVARDLWTTIT